MYAYRITYLVGSKLIVEDVKLQTEIKAQEDLTSEELVKKLGHFATVVSWSPYHKKAVANFTPKTIRSSLLHMGGGVR